MAIKIFGVEKSETSVVVLFLVSVFLLTVSREAAALMSGRKPTSNT